MALRSQHKLFEAAGLSCLQRPKQSGEGCLYRSVESGLEEFRFCCPLLCVATTGSDILLVRFAASLGPGWVAGRSVSACAAGAGPGRGGAWRGYFIFGTW